MISHDFRDALSSDPMTGPDALRWKKRKVLHALRQHYGMDAAFISRFSDAERIFEEVDIADEVPPFGFARGTVGPRNESYCDRIARGIAPQVMQDATQEPSVADLVATRAIPVGAHISVPIRLSTGRIYGMLCAFGRDPQPDLTERETAMFKLCADLLARDIETLMDTGDHDTTIEDLLQNAVGEGNFRFFLQPICALPDGKPVGFELLTRFPGAVGQSEDIFRRAKHLDMVAPLEEVIAKRTPEVLAHLPRDMTLSVNFSVTSIEDLDFASLFAPEDRARVIIEVTEHERVNDYEGFQLAVARLRALGHRVAIDDVGAGYSSLRHMVQLRPDFIKIDRSLVAGLDHSGERASLVAALRDYAAAHDAQLIAEGVETKEELAALIHLRISRVQGYLTGVPRPWREALEAL